MKLIQWAAAIAGMFGLTLAVVRPTVAQSAHCSEPTHWQQCALEAAGFNSHPPGVIRQLLFIDRSGPPHLPFSGLLLRESADSVYGWSFSIWPLSAAESPLAKQRCERRWQNDGGMLCMGHPGAERDWRVVLDSLDRLGIGTIPMNPVTMPASCLAGDGTIPPLPPALGESASPEHDETVVYGDLLPVDCLTDMVFDGAYLDLTVWFQGVVWQYTIGGVGQHSTTAVPRDWAIMGLVHGVM